MRLWEKAYKGKGACTLGGSPKATPPKRLAPFSWWTTHRPLRSIHEVIDPVNSFENHVAARVLDFLDARTPWHRRLWNIGLNLTLQEVLEAVTAVRAGVLSAAARAFLTESAQKHVARDPGAGTVHEREVLQAALRAKLRPEGLDANVIDQRQASLAQSYLARWADALRQTTPEGERPRPERTARAVVSHLLDCGFSSDYLHRWWAYRIKHEDPIRPLADLVDEAHELSLTPKRGFQVLIPVTTAIRLSADAEAPNWRTASEVSEWLRLNDYDVAGVRQDGGFLLNIEALDAEGAVGQATEIVDRLVARLAVGTRRSLKLHGRLWIKGGRAAYAMDRKRRGVWVEALEREQQLYSINSTGAIDAALELLSHLQSSSPAAAVAGGWAAIEALLSEPDDRAGAAERLAMLVACSFPRAELTTLSYALEKSDPGFASRVAGITENRVRCDHVAATLRGERVNPALGLSDRAAALRIQKLLRNPHAALADVCQHAAIAFRRVYRQRNLVLHWGRTDAVALRACLRTAAPLVGAGLDRIIHAHYVDRLNPLQLVARARIALSTVGTRGGPSCTELLR